MEKRNESVGLLCTMNSTDCVSGVKFLWNFFIKFHPDIIQTIFVPSTI